MLNRRQFVQRLGQFGAVALLSPLSACTSSLKTADMKISLAQWSLHRAFQKGDLDPLDFSSIARDQFDIEAVEYVNGFYADQGEDEIFWQDMRRRADAAGVSSQLIMVDDEGELGHPDPAQRQTAVENHYKWVHAAKILGGHSIRVNAFGSGDRPDLRANLIDGLGRLAGYAAGEEINVLIENHGLHTSDADFIVGIIEQINAPNLGTLPAFGNWCLNAEWGSTQGGRCTESFDLYEGVRKFLPYARAVSAKSYDFDAEGNETNIDYPRMLQIVKEAGFEGYIGIEYEGEGLSEAEGIRATKALLERA
jgi:sugar phosphate isomerase/epimerase